MKLETEEFVLLFDAFKSSNPAYPYWECDAFCHDSSDSSECLTEFRVSKEDLPHLAEVLRVPPHLRYTPKELYVVELRVCVY